MFSSKDIIEMAIQIEKNGEKIYRKAIGEVSNLSLVSLIQHLADEEIRHVEWFSQLDKETATTVNDPRVEEAGRKLLQKILGDQSFSLADADFSNMEGVEALLATAIEFEKDTALFYEMIRPFVQDQIVLNHLDRIIAEEQQHARDLEQFLNNTLSKKNRREPE